MKHILEYNKFNELNINNYRNKIDFSRSLLIINTFKEIIDLSSIKNRRFMYNPKTGTLILGDENKNVENSSHDSEFHYTNIKEKYDDFVRGWIGFNDREFKNGIIQFYGSINNYDNIFDTIQMFAYMDGIKPKTKIIGTTQSTYTQSNYTFIEDYLPDTYKNNFKLFKESINDILEAPNGQKSNLTEKQWHQVRTPEFKAWFGDWENDPKSASKIVDDNGEPLVVYHGTKREFDAFDYKEIGTATDDNGFLGYGFYFADIESEARMYSFSSIVKSVFLNIRSPYKHTLEDIDELRNNGIDVRDKVEMNIDFDSLAEKLKSIDELMYNFFMYLGKYGYSKGWKLFMKEYNNETIRNYEINGLDLNDIADLYNATTDNYGQITDFDKENLIKLGIEPSTLKYKIDYDEHAPHLSEITKYGERSQEVTNVIKKLGYDGVFLGEIVAFYPNQIKSATDNNGDFDPNNENITK